MHSRINPANRFKGIFHPTHEGISSWHGGELIIDRIHRLPKPPHLPETIPRDTIVCIQFLPRERKPHQRHKESGYLSPNICQLSFLRWPVKIHYASMKESFYYNQTPPQPLDPIEVGPPGKTGDHEGQQIHSLSSAKPSSRVRKEKEHPRPISTVPSTSSSPES